MQHQDCTLPLIVVPKSHVHEMDHDPPPALLGSRQPRLSSTMRREVEYLGQSLSRYQGTRRHHRHPFPPHRSSWDFRTTALTLFLNAALSLRHWTC